MKNEMKNLYNGYENFKYTFEKGTQNQIQLIELFGNVKVLEYRANETIEKHNNNCDDKDFLAHDLVYFIQDLEQRISHIITTL